MIVCIAEKPSVARDIARVIGATQSKQGYMEGNGYQVTWTFGHLCELKMPEDYTEQWKAWALGSLPMVPPRFGIRLKDDEGVRRQFAVIERLMSQADSIVNCGDAGQEGELIQRWVMQKAKATCPVQRLWISSMTDEAIREGFAHLKEQKDYDSLWTVGCRRGVAARNQCHTTLFHKIRAPGQCVERGPGANAHAGNDSATPKGNRQLCATAILGALHNIQGH